MEFLIMSREEAQDFSHRIDLEKMYAIISITDIDKKDNEFNNNEHIVDIVKLKFEDTISKDPDFMTQEDANKIVEFVNKNKDKVDCFIVHCEAGFSRSAGVCAAIADTLGEDTWWIFKTYSYGPNMDCFHLVWKTFNGEMPEDKIKEYKEKEKINLSLWYGKFKEENC